METSNPTEMKSDSTVIIYGKGPKRKREEVVFYPDDELLQPENLKRSCPRYF